MTRILSILLLLLASPCLAQSGNANKQPEANAHTQLLNDLVQADIREVTIPSGNYVIDQPIVLSVSDQIVNAYGVTIRQEKNFKGEGFWTAKGTAEKRLSKVWIKGLTLRGRRSTSPGIVADWTTRFRLYDCFIHDFDAQGLVLENGFDTGVYSSGILACGSHERDLPAVELDAIGDGTKTIDFFHTVIEDSDGTGLKARNQWSFRMLDCKVHGKKREDAAESRLGIYIHECNGVRLTDTLMVGIGEMMRIENSWDVEVKGTIERARR